jgi:hypothetical protein
VMTLRSVPVKCLGFFIWFIYTGYLPCVLQEYPLDDEALIHLLFVSEEFLMPDLKAHCTRLLLRILSPDNSSTIFNSTLMLGNTELLVAAALVTLLSMSMEQEENPGKSVVGNKEIQGCTVVPNEEFCVHILEYIAGIE